MDVLSPMVVLEGTALSYERGTPVQGRRARPVKRRGSPVHARLLLRVQGPSRVQFLMSEAALYAPNSSYSSALRRSEGRGPSSEEVALYMRVYFCVCGGFGWEHLLVSVPSTAVSG